MRLYRFKKVVTPIAKREAISHLCDHHKVSERRACKMLQFDRSSIRYKSRTFDDVLIRFAMKRITNDTGYLQISAPIQPKNSNIHYSIELERHKSVTCLMSSIFSQIKMPLEPLTLMRESFTTKHTASFLNSVPRSLAIPFLLDG
jgi:hypothetical protein